jgi:formylglycine-generating enzyme required for sulfatase activity
MMVAGLLAALPAAAAFAADAKLERKTIEIKGTVVKFDMLKLPAGSVEIKAGDQTVKRDVKSIWMTEAEVSWDEFDTYAFGLDITDTKEKIDSVGTTRPSKPYGAPDFGFGHSGYPCLADTCFSAEMYCKWLSQKTGKKFRLPTEAEWEYAARCGGAPVQLDDDALDKVAWYEKNSDEAPHPIKKKAANAWGFYDMLGNALEWVEKDPETLKADEAADKATADSDKPTHKATTPMAKGGSWKDPADKVNTSQKFYQTPSWNVTDPQNPKSHWWLSDGKFIAFRVVCED